jgi:predicted NBD/HSP70 family sugar kinase
MADAGSHRAEALRLQGALAVLRYVHRWPGTTRAELARALGLSSGSAAEITARLRAARLVDATAAMPSGSRGRPTTHLVAHPDGPLVCVVEITHERWRVATAEIGCALTWRSGGRHRDRAADVVLDGLRGELERVVARYPDRVRGIAVVVPGTVSGQRVVQASNLGWVDVDLRRLLPAVPLPLAVGNDATAAGVAEARRGAAVGASVVLHLAVEVGVGGTLVVGGQPVVGARGAGGEFGHMPFGDRSLRCPCGAHGCWDLAVDGRAMARTAGLAEPADPRTYAERVLAAARVGEAAARRSVEAAARALGAGAAALVNALDPEVVTLGGLADDLLAACPEEVDATFLAGLMHFRRASPPALVPAALGDDAGLVGAAEAAFDTLLTEPSLSAWLGNNLLEVRAVKRPV